MNKPNSNTEKGDVSLSRRKKRSVFWWAKRFIQGILAIIFILFMVVQMPEVQIWMAKKATKFLSDELHTQISVDKVRLNVFNGVYLENLYVEDQSGDTLLNTELLRVNFDKGLLGLLFKKLEIEDVHLMGADFNLRFPYGGDRNNLQFILDYFKKAETRPKEKTKSSPFSLNIQSVYLDRVHFLKSDSIGGQDLEIFVKTGEIEVDTLLLTQKRLAVGSAYFDGVQLNINEFYGSMPWDTFLVNREKVYESYVAEKTNPTDSVFFHATVGNFELRNGGFELHNYRNEPVKLTSDDDIDYQHLRVFDFNALIRDFSFSQWEFRGQVAHIALKEGTGFELNHLSAGEVIVNDHLTQLNGLKLQTPQSDIGDTLSLKYSRFLDYQSFVEKVRMDGRFNGARIALEDIMTFAPKLKTNRFFVQNKKEIFELDGRLYGKVNRLNGRDLRLRLQNRLFFQGDFNSRDLAIQDEQFMDLDIKRLRTNMSTLRGLIPSFNPPPNFDKLGRFDFSGEFFGFFVDFAVTGKLRSPIGRGEMDMQMVLKNGRDKAKYSGGLSLFDFDLGTWSENPNLGNITFKAKVKEGVGLRLDNANAVLEGTIDSLEFKGYNYKNVSLNGRLRQNLFDGDLRVLDNNINLVFGGEIDFTDSIPVFDFFADLRHLNLKALHLAQRDLRLSGAVDLKLKDIRPEKILGDAIVRDFRMIRDRQDTVLIDSVLVSSHFNPLGEKYLTVRSDILTADMVGQFDIAKIPEAFFQFMNRNYAEFSRRFGLKSKGVPINPGKFTYEIELLKPEPVIQLLNPQLTGFEHTKIKGAFDIESDILQFDVEVPSAGFGNVLFDDLIAFGEAEQSEATFDLGIHKTSINNKINLSPIALLGMVNSDTLEFGITSLNLTKMLDHLNLNGRLVLEDSADYRIQLFSSDLSGLSEKWTISDDNYILLAKNRVETKNLELVNGPHRIRLEHQQGAGLKLSVENVDMTFINKVWVYEPLDFSGYADIYLTVGNLFKLRDLNAVVSMDSLLINGDDYGKLWITGSTPQLKERILAGVAITKGNQTITGEGFYYPPNYEGVARIGKNKEETFVSNYLDIDLSVRQFPVRFLEYFLKPSIKGTQGFLTVDGKLFGPLNKLQANGVGRAWDVATTIVFLNTRFSAPTSKIFLRDNLFDVTGTQIFDQEGNAAQIYGGVTHENLKNLGLDVRIVTSGSKFVAMNTEEGSNPYIYGKVVGTGYAQFTGYFRQPAVYISATSAEGTKVVIPISYSQNAEEVRFIKFPEPADQDDKNEPAPTPPELRGLNIEMDIVANENAEVEMVFDKYWGDVIRGVGNGNLKIIMTREGEFNMRGDYVVSRGEYLFTLMNLLVNKPFVVEPGGTIKWTGDPFNADLNLKAVYAGVNTSVANFIQEYLASAPSDVQQLSRNPTSVDLKMLLTGKLLTPNINFDIEFNDLPPELRNYVDSKLRIVRQDQNELNRQVFGLLVLGQFMPTNYNIQATDLGINTVSEMIANQLSMYVSEIVSDMLSEGGVISGFDFDLRYSQYQFTGIDDPSSLESTSELSTKLKLQLGKNNRWQISWGGNFDLANGRASAVNPNNENLFTNEITLEYTLTKDRRLKIKVYNKTEPDIAGGRRRKTGIGLNFSKEFDSLSELFKRRKKK